MQLPGTTRHASRYSVVVTELELKELVLVHLKQTVTSGDLCIYLYNPSQLTSPLPMQGRRS